MDKKVVSFEFEKETKHSVRFKEMPEAGQAPVAGTVYLQKWFVGNKKKVKLTFEVED